MKAFRTPKESLGDLEADVAATLVAAASDIALAIDDEGTIHDAAFQRADLPLELKNSDRWIGRPWQATVAEESLTKIDQFAARSCHQQSFAMARGPLSGHARP